MIQEKQSIDQGTKYPPTGLQRSILPYSLFTIFLRPMHRLPVETAVLLLAKPIL